MKIKLRTPEARKLATKFKLGWLDSRLKYASLLESIEIDISRLPVKELDAATQFLQGQAEEGCASAARKLVAYKGILGNAKERPVKRLEELEEAIFTFMRDVPNNWLFSSERDPNERMLPYLVTHVQHFPYDKRSETEAHVNLTAQAMVRGDTIQVSSHWNRRDLGGKTVVQLLLGEGYVPATPELIAEYGAQMDRYLEVHRKSGLQMVGSGMASVLGNSYGTKHLNLVQDGTPHKLVVDDLNDDGGKFESDSPMRRNLFLRRKAGWGEDDDDDEDTSEDGMTAVPTHPYLKLFDLEKHEHILAHVACLTEYQYDTELADKLILPKDDTDLVRCLMETAHEHLDDIISGKSAGTIVCGTGPAGTGKTLTAEVTSEAVKRPLYAVNCSQLGTDEEQIEERLGLVLNRAVRWGAIILIDEADVYIATRGRDIQQNAIVGVFLRILERFNGILFLTSNLETIIDDAILSRCTAHICYALPSAESAEKIWSIQSKQHGFALSAATIATLTKWYPKIAGRDIKELVKLAKRYGSKHPAQDRLELIEAVAKYRGIRKETF